MKAVEIIGDVDEQRLRAQVPDEVPVGQVRVTSFCQVRMKPAVSGRVERQPSGRQNLSDPLEDIYTLDDGEPLNVGQ